MEYKRTRMASSALYSPLLTNGNDLQAPCVCVCGGQFAFPFYSVVNRDVTLHHLSALPPEVECHRSTAVL